MTTAVRPPAAITGGVPASVPAGVPSAAAVAATVMCFAFDVAMWLLHGSTCPRCHCCSPSSAAAVAAGFLVSGRRILSRGPGELFLLPKWSALFSQVFNYLSVVEC